MVVLVMPPLASIVLRRAAAICLARILICGVVFVSTATIVAILCGSKMESRLIEEPEATGRSVSEEDLGYRPIEAPDKFLIEEEDFCHRYPGLYIIAYVFSTISGVDKRRITRDTWATLDMYSKYGIKMATVFIVGRAKNETEENILRRESQLYHDMIQGDFEDAYHLLPYKGLASLVWVTRHCSFVPWIFHADDDAIVDPWMIHQKMKEFERDQMPSQFYCRPVRSPRIKREGKWALPEKVFPGKTNPDYCPGPAWFIPTDLAPRLLDASRRVNYLFIDDIYLTGYVAREAGLGPLKDIVSDYFAGNIFEASHVGSKFEWHNVVNDRLAIWKMILAYHTQ